MEVPLPGDTDPTVILYTDGACIGNPGPGGWAYILHHVPTGKRSEASGGSARTTNNRMELTAVIRGLGRLTQPCRVRLISDSEYTIKGITEWLPAWKSRGWKRKEGKRLRPVRNEDLWRRLDALLQGHEVTCEHVYGHTGHPENERCDQLAVAAAEQAVANNDPADLDPAEGLEAQ
jgi:ribonuclease HI